MGLIAAARGPARPRRLETLVRSPWAGFLLRRLLALVVILLALLTVGGIPFAGLIRGSVPDLADLPAGCAFHPRCALVREQCRVAGPPPAGRAGGRRVANEVLE